MCDLCDTRNNMIRQEETAATAGDFRTAYELRQKRDEWEEKNRNDNDELATVLTSIFGGNEAKEPVAPPTQEQVEMMKNEFFVKIDDPIDVAFTLREKMTLRGFSPAVADQVSANFLLAALAGGMGR